MPSTAARRSHRIVVVEEAALGASMRREIAAMLARTLDDGWRYEPAGWRTLVPAFRVLALDGGDRLAGQASGFAVPTGADLSVAGVGDLAVDHPHRGQGVAARLAEHVTAEAWRRGADVALAKTKPLRGVLARLGYVPVEGFSFYYVRGGERRAHLDWMAAVRPGGSAPLEPVCLAEGDF